MDRKRCPFLLGEKCIGDECMFWGVESFEDSRTRTERLEAGCLLVFQYQITRYAAGEHARVQASVDKVATEVQGLGERSLVVAAATELRRRLEAKTPKPELISPAPTSGYSDPGLAEIGGASAGNSQGPAS